MSSEFETYLDRTIRLVGTLVIKHEAIADAINAHLVRSGYIVHPTDRSTWKYYLNLSGMYHQYDHDQILLKSKGVHDQMTIVVAGDIRPMRVNFNKELMNGVNSDPVLAEEYRTGTDYYLELLSRYPDMEDLISGILNPMPMDLLLSARNGEVLHLGGYYRTVTDGVVKFSRRVNSQLYRDRYIEEYEVDIIFAIEEKIKLFFGKMLNHAFTCIDDLYFPSIYYLLIANLILVIHNIRLKNSHGAMAHEYHVKAHLNSFGGIGRYIDNLKRKEYLWLYRNVEWLLSNNGTPQNMDAIIANILTPSYVPISAYVLSHDNTRIQQDLHSSLIGRELPLNFNPLNLLSPENISPTTLLKKEIGLARDNENELDVDQVYLQLNGSLSDVSRFNTKLLESRLIDFSNLYPVQLEWTLLNYWAYAICRGTYYGFVFVTHPKTGARIQLTMLNAFVLMLYCFNKGYFNQTLATVPPVNISGVLREQGYTLNADFPARPTFASLRAKASKALPDSDIVKIMDTPLVSYNYTGSVAFYTRVEGYWLAANQHYAYQSNCQRLHQTAQRDITARRLYWHNMPLAHPHTGKSYDEFLTQINFDDSGFESQQYLSLMISLFNGGTGFVENVNSRARNVQTACIAILKFFGSYSVHHSKGSSSFSPIHSREPALKIEDLSIFMESRYHLTLKGGDRQRITSNLSSEQYILKENDSFSNIKISNPLDLGRIITSKVALKVIETRLDLLMVNRPLDTVVLVDGQ